MERELVCVKRIAHPERETEMDRERPHPHSHLFTVQLWQEELGQGQTEWRGKAHHVSSGQVHYFREWPKLILFLQTMLSNSESGTQREQE